MERTRYNGKVVESAAGTKNIPLNSNSAERLIARKVEVIKAELEALHQLTLTSAVNNESSELARKYVMFYEIAHSLYGHIQLQKDFCFSAIKLVNEAFSKVDDEARASYKVELQNLQSAYEELAAAGRALKPPSFPEFVAVREVDQLPPEPSTLSAKRPTALTDHQPAPRTKNARLEHPQKIAPFPEIHKLETHPSAPYEPKTYEQLQQLAQSQNQPGSGSVTRRKLSPKLLAQPKHSFSSPMRELEHPKPQNEALSLVVRKEIIPEPGRKLSDQTSNVSPGLRTIHSLPHGDVVCSIVSLSADASLIYTGGLGSVKLWDTTKHTTVAALSLESMDNYIRSCKISPDGKTLVVGGESDKIVLWDISQSPPGSLACFVASSTAIYAMAFSPDSRHLYTCCSGGEILVWDIFAKKRIRSLVGHSLGVTCVDITPDGRRLVTGGLDKTVRIWDLSTFTQISCCNLSSPIFSLGLGCFSTPFNENDAVVVAGAESSFISVLPFMELVRNHPKLATSIETFGGHATCVISLKFSPDKRHFVSTGKEGLILGWKLNATSPGLVKLFTHHEVTSVLSCDISQDGKHLITGSGGKFATVYQLQW